MGVALASLTPFFIIKPNNMEVLYFVFIMGGIYGLANWLEYKEFKLHELERELILRSYYNSGKPKE